MELLDLTIKDEKSLGEVSERLQWAIFRPEDVVKVEDEQLQITFERHCLEEWNVLDRSRTAVPGFLRLTYPLVRSRLTLSGLKSLKQNDVEKYDIAQFDYIHMRSAGFKLSAEPLTWVFDFEDGPRGSLRDIEVLPKQGKRIQVTDLGLTLIAIPILAVIASIVWLIVS